MAQARLDGPQYVPTDEAFPYAHTFVSVGNPHVVIPVADVQAFPLAQEGPALEHHPWFPERANVEIVEHLDEHRIRMRVWERGVGETRACGTGACAVAVAAVTNGTATSPVTVELPGGKLVIEVGDDGFVTMHGPARRIERLTIPADCLA
jgi:diaminopimelate epimerase